jgi:hypothetical protein
MGNLRRLMKINPDAMADKLIDDAAVMSSGIIFNDLSDLIQKNTRL